ncbi:hypothetical protein HYW67_01860 [Candidatus Parcubacteria bacterium]|nr:hypothetical protein [Candidatus Parcubacteria bacterium]
MTVREAVSALRCFQRFDELLNTADATEVWFEGERVALRSAAEERLLAFLDEQSTEELTLAGFGIRAERPTVGGGELRVITVTPPDPRQLELALVKVYSLRPRQRRR